MVKYRTLDYNNLNYIIHKKDLKFKHVKQLSDYFAKHPNLIYKIMTRPLPFTEALKEAVQFFVPELRIASHVETHCTFHKKHLKMWFYIQHANKRKADYWLRLSNDINHSQRVPFFVITPFLHRTKSAWFNFYRLWHEHPYKAVSFYNINEVNNKGLKHSVSLYYVGHDVKSAQSCQKVNLNHALKKGKVKKYKTTDLDYVYKYLIDDKWYYIKSEKFAEEVVNNQ